MDSSPVTGHPPSAGVTESPLPQASRNGISQPRPSASDATRILPPQLGKLNMGLLDRDRMMRVSTGPLSAGLPPGFGVTPGSQGQIYTFVGGQSVPAQFTFRSTPPSHAQPHFYHTSVPLTPYTPLGHAPHHTPMYPQYRPHMTPPVLPPPVQFYPSQPNGGDPRFSTLTTPLSGYAQPSIPTSQQQMLRVPDEGQETSRYHAGYPQPGGEEMGGAAPEGDQGEGRSWAGEQGDGVEASGEDLRAPARGQQGPPGRSTTSTTQSGSPGSQTSHIHSTTNHHSPPLSHPYPTQPTAGTEQDSVPEPVLQSGMLLNPAHELPAGMSSQSSTSSRTSSQLTPPPDIGFPSEPAARPSPSETTIPAHHSESAPNRLPSHHPMTCSPGSLVVSPEIITPAETRFFGLSPIPEQRPVDETMRPSGYEEEREGDMDVDDPRAGWTRREGRMASDSSMRSMASMRTLRANAAYGGVAMERKVDSGVCLSEFDCGEGEGRNQRNRDRADMEFLIFSPPSTSAEPAQPTNPPPAQPLAHPPRQLPLILPQQPNMIPADIARHPALPPGLPHPFPYGRIQRERREQLLHSHPSANPYLPHPTPTSRAPHQRHHPLPSGDTIPPLTNFNFDLYDPLANSLVYELPLPPPPRDAVRVLDIRSGDGLRAMRDLEEELAGAVGLDMDGWAEVAKRWFVPQARVSMVLTSDEEEVGEFDFNALFLAPFFHTLHSSGLSSQILRVTETSETSIVFSGAPSCRLYGEDGEDVQSETGILLEADDYRWRFGYADGRVIEWEGTISVVWAPWYPSKEEDGKEGKLKVERMEVAVHEWKLVGGDVEEGWEWGMPDTAMDVLKMIESCERFEPVRALADDHDVEYDVVLDRLLSKYDPEEIFWDGGSDTGDEDELESPEEGIREVMMGTAAQEVDLPIIVETGEDGDSAMSQVPAKGMKEGIKKERMDEEEDGMAEEEDGDEDDLFAESEIGVDDGRDRAEVYIE